MKTTTLFFILFFSCQMAFGQDNTYYTGIFEGGNDGYVLYSTDASKLAEHVSKGNVDNLELVDFEFNYGNYIAVYRSKKFDFMGFYDGDNITKFVDRCNESLNLIDNIAIKNGVYYACSKANSAVRSHVVASHSWEEFVTKWQELSGEGYRLVDVETEPYSMGIVKGRRYIGIFHSGSGGHYLYSFNSWNQFTAKWDELAKQNMRLIDIETFKNGGTTTFIGVWRPGNKPYALYRIKGWDNFTAKWDELAKQGLRLVDIQTD